ncbi:MAG: RidA family protein [Caulobacteraceae bacterium]|nr:RidA family protein [Caulobacteraceae bacterium]
MKTQKISSGSSFEQVAGYSRAMLVEHDRYAEVLISGCTGFDYSTMTISDDLAEQVRRAFVNIADVLAKAGGDLSHLVRVRYYVTETDAWDRAAPVFGEALGEIRPAATCVVCGLVDPRMKIEIEADARIPR